MADWFVSSTHYVSVAAWAASTTLVVGNIRRQLTTPTIGNERCYRVSSITTGITSATEPTWPLSASSTVVDGGVTWTECTGQSAYNTPSILEAPAARLELINGTRTANGDLVYVSNTHSETTAGSIGWGGHLMDTMCYQVSGASNPVSPANHSTGAIVATTGATSDILFAQPAVLIKGITFNIGSSTNTASFTIGTNGNPMALKMVNCAINLNNTSSNSRIAHAGYGNAICYMELVNTTVQFGHVGQGFSFGASGGALRWTGSGSALLGIVPTTLFNTDTRFNLVEIDGVDLSTLNTTLFTLYGPGNTFYGSIEVRNCKLNASVALPSNIILHSHLDRINFDNNDDTTNNRKHRMLRNSVCGQTQSNEIVARTNGAVRSSVHISWVLTCVSASSIIVSAQQHPSTPWLDIDNTTIGSLVTLSVEVICNKSAKMGTDVLFAEVQYLGSSASPLGSFLDNSAGEHHAIAVAGTASTSDWTAGSSAARANSHAYVTGDAIKLASNAGRLFFCTSGGTSTSSEPGGYATAVDGGSVTDGGATFRAGWRQTLSLAVTPQRAGIMSIRVHSVDVQSSVTNVYIDPFVTVS